MCVDETRRLAIEAILMLPFCSDDQRTGSTYSPSAVPGVSKSAASFNSEAELLRRFCNELHRSFVRSSVCISEFDCSNGVADLILVRLVRNWRDRCGIADVSP